MPSIKIKKFSISVPTNSKINVNVEFDITQTDTEKRLEIPGKVFFHLMEWDGSYKDTMNLTADGSYLRTGEQDDDIAAFYKYAGMFTSGTYKFTFSVDKSHLPGEWGNEEWYVIGECTADVIDSLTYSKHLSLNLA